MVIGHFIASITTSARNWSLFAGSYMFTCGIVVALLISDILSVLADVLGLATGYWMVIFASPAFAIGAGLWWAIVERRHSYTYRHGGAFGLVTALCTGLMWTAEFIRIWGVEMAVVPMVGALIGLVFGLTAFAGVLTALPLMYARRRLGPDLSGRSDPAL